MSQFTRTGKNLSYPVMFFELAERFGPGTLICLPAASKKRAQGLRQFWYSFGKSLRLRASGEIPCSPEDLQRCRTLAPRIDMVEFLIRDHFGMQEELIGTDVQVRGIEEALGSLRKEKPDATASDLWFLIIRDRDMSLIGRIMKQTLDHMREKEEKAVKDTDLSKGTEVSAEEAMRKLGYL